MTTVRLGTEADPDTAVAVWRASDDARRGGPTRPVVEDTVRSRIGRDRSWLTVAEDGDEMVGVASAMPARRVQLWTHEDNQRSQRLYRGRGFQHEGRTKDPGDGGSAIGLWSRDL